MANFRADFPDRAIPKTATLFIFVGGHAISCFIMDLRQRLKEISEFILPYQRIWQNEIMLDYPAPTVAYPAHWVEELMQIKNKEDLIALGKRIIPNYLFHRNSGSFSHVQKLWEILRRPRSLHLCQSRHGLFCM